MEVTALRQSSHPSQSASRLALLSAAAALLVPPAASALLALIDLPAAGVPIGWLLPSSPEPSPPRPPASCGGEDEPGGPGGVRTAEEEEECRPPPSPWTVRIAAAALSLHVGLGAGYVGQDHLVLARPDRGGENGTRRA
jgi:hypothetical protein